MLEMQMLKTVTKHLKNALVHLEMLILGGKLHFTTLICYEGDYFTMINATNHFNITTIVLIYLNNAGFVCLEALTEVFL